MLLFGTAKVVRAHGVGSKQVVRVVGHLGQPLFRSDGAATNIETCDLQHICVAAGIPVKHRTGHPKTRSDMVEEHLQLCVVIGRLVRGRAAAADSP